MDEYKGKVKKMLSPEREQDLLDRLLGYVGEYFDGSQLYDILHNTLEMSHEDMEGLGFDLSDCYEPSEDYIARQIEEDIKNPLASSKTKDLIATYEEIHRVPHDDCITQYIGDLGGHFYEHGVSQNQIRHAYEKALEAIGMDSDTFQSTREFLYRGEIIGKMRESLLADALAVGDKVLFVATEPYGGTGDFALRGGIVQSIDPEASTCAVQGMFFTMEDVPLRYVLGLHNPDIADTHYGFKQVRPLFGEYPNLVDHYLREAEEKWNASLAQKQEPPAMSM